MLARRLDYCPSAESLPMTVQVMIEDLHRRGLTDVDAMRVQAAFEELGNKINRWPTSFKVIEALPKRAPQKNITRQSRQTRDLDEVLLALHHAIEHKGKYRSVMLPGEGYGDYRKAYEKSNLTMQQFNDMRLNLSQKKRDDDEARAERAAIQGE